MASVRVRRPVRPGLGLRRRAAAVAAAMALAVTLASCSHDSSPPKPPGSSSRPPTTPPTSTATTPTKPAAKRWPLTGLPRAGKLPDHPVYVVKVDNTSSSRPQEGLADADMMVEELVEGGLTRLAAFYYSKAPSNIGPVRSMRASDIGIVEPANAFLVASGAAGKTMKLLNQAGINRITEGALGFYRSSRRPAPYNLFVHLAALARHVGRPWHPPAGPYLPFKPTSFHGHIPVTHMAVQFSGAHTTSWRYVAGSWVRTDSNAAAGHDFRVKNVLILRVRIGNAGYLDPAGNPVPETFFYGSGPAILVHGPHAVKGTWHKNGTRGRVTLTNLAGRPLPVTPGHTFIELVPRTSYAHVSLGH